MVLEELNIFLWMLTTCSLLVLCIYNVAIFFVSRIKSFLFYSLYNFFLLIYLFLFSGYFEFVLPDVMKTEERWFIQVIYNLIYLQFFRHFLDLKVRDPKLDKLLKVYFQVSLFGMTAICFTLFLLQDLSLFFYFFSFLFLPSVLLLSVYSLYKAAQLNYNLKYYIIIGASAYISFAMYAFYISLKEIYFFSLDPITPFYIGILLESFVFSMGLGHKVKKISKERMLAKQLFIEQLQENETIKEAANKRLEKEVRTKTKELVSVLKEREEERLEKISLQYEQKLLELKFVSLRNQMNPHFIFNALNSIQSSIINGDKANSIDYLNKFSKLLREILKSSDKLIYTLHEELEVLKLYLHIENIRLESKVECVFDIQEGLDLTKYKIPPLLLQPLVENSIWHGLSLVETSFKRIMVSISKDIKTSAFLTITIEDNGIGLEKARQINGQKTRYHDSLGVKLVEDRLALFSQKLNADYYIEISDLKHISAGKQGTQVVIRLPVSNAIQIAVIDIFIPKNPT